LPCHGYGCYAVPRLPCPGSTPHARFGLFTFICLHLRSFTFTHGSLYICEPHAAHTQFRFSFTVYTTATTLLIYRLVLRFRVLTYTRGWLPAGPGSVGSPHVAFVTFTHYTPHPTYTHGFTLRRFTLRCRLLHTHHYVRGYGYGWFLYALPPALRHIYHTTHTPHGYRVDSRAQHAHGYPFYCFVYTRLGRYRGCVVTTLHGYTHVGCALVRTLRTTRCGYYRRTLHALGSRAFRLPRSYYARGYTVDTHTRLHVHSCCCGFPVVTPHFTHAYTRTFPHARLHTFTALGYRTLPCGYRTPFCVTVRLITVPDYPCRLLRLHVCSLPLYRAGFYAHSYTRAPLTRAGLRCLPAFPTFRTHTCHVLTRYPVARLHGCSFGSAVVHV